MPDSIIASDVSPPVDAARARRDWVVLIDSMDRTLDVVRHVPIEPVEWDYDEPDPVPSAPPIAMQWIDTGTATLATALQGAPADARGWTPLHWAIALRLSTLSVELVRAGVGFEAAAQLGERPLHFATALDDTDVANALLEAGADVHARTTGGYSVHLRLPYADTELIAAGRTALHYAADRGNAHLVERLLAAGADPNAADDDGVIPLMLAADAEIVRIFLDRGVKVDVLDICGAQAVHYAAREGRLSALRALLDAGADLHAMTGVKRGHTVLTYAIERRVGKSVLPTVEALVARGVNVNQPAADKMTALEYAVRQNDPAVVSRLLDLGADVNASSYRGTYPLLASFGICGGDRVDVTAILVQAGADVNLCNFKKESALTLATSRACINRVKMLLAAGASIDHADRDGWTALHHAARHVRTDILATLLAAGASREAVDKKGRRPIDLATNPQSRALLEGI